MDSWSCCGGNACYNEASLWILGVVVVAMHATMRQVYGFLELLWWQCMLQWGKSMDSWSCCGGNACYNEASLWILGVVVVAMHATMWQVYGFLELLWWQCMLQ